MKSVKGVDTTFLIELEISELPKHQSAKAILEKIITQKDSLALCPQVLTEFMHIVTDAKRFHLPLTMQQAVARTKFWWEAEEVTQVLPNEGSTKLFLEWITKHELGRKRLLNTQLAATYFSAGIQNIISSNYRDYKVFDCFNVIVP